MVSKPPWIIVTGAAGFIGSVLAWELNQRGKTHLLLVDDLGNSAKWKNLVPLVFSEYMEKDHFLQSVLAGRLDAWDIEAVIHLGACSATTETDASYLIRNNFEYSKVLAEWCLRRSIRFVYASSAATYGDGEQGYKDDHGSLASLRPLNPYGYSKHLFDLWNLRRGHLDKIVGLKYFNVFGPNEYHKDGMRSMALKAHEQIRKGDGRVKLFKSHRPDYKDGEQLRDFVYVKDAVDMTLFFLDTGTPGGIFNVGTGMARSWLDMMNALFKSLGRLPQIDFVPMPEILQGKYQYHTQADLTKLKSAGYAKPTRTLEDGIADYATYLEADHKILGWS